MPEDLKAARGLNKAEVERVLTKYMLAKRSDLEAAVQAEETPMIERIVISIAIRAMVDGDQAALTFVLDRLVGPVKKDGNDVNLNFNFSALPREQVIELGRQAVAFLEGKKA